MTPDLAALVLPADHLAYLPNKLHGDERVATDGTAYVETHPEWLDAEVVAAMLTAPSFVGLALVDWAGHGTPTMYRFAGRPANLWKSALRQRYMCDDGSPPADASYALVAHRWGTPAGDSLLLFRIEC